jgi:hypothetical protein
VASPRFQASPFSRRSNLKFARFVSTAPKLPKSFEFDEKYIAVPTPMFANDEHGNCVIAGRAHQTLRFEYLELKRLLKITDAEVLRQWRRENGNTDDGLVVLDSLKRWRKRGWKAGGLKGALKIRAFTELNWKKKDEIRQAIVMQVGVGIGLTLPFNALERFQAGQVWDVGTGAKAKPDPDGGHYVYCSGYTEDGPICVTWGRKQHMTWRFLSRYADEAYAVVCRRCKAKKSRGSGRLARLRAANPRGRAGYQRRLRHL